MEKKELIRTCPPVYGKNAFQGSFDSCGDKNISVKQLN